MKRLIIWDNILHQMEMDSYHRAHEEPLIVHEINDRFIQVENFAKDTKYYVRREDNYIVDFDCPHRVYRNVICKHMVIATEETNTQLL